MEVLDHTAGETPSPVDVALAFRAAVQQRQTLSPDESRKYRSAVRALRWSEGRQRSWIARLLGISPSAVTKLLGPKPKTTQTTEAAA
ncbi:hypothetical protein [Dactylosporangium sp. CA-139066]|uniref:hypothetical protein n=1 Tax=Dactylosporangium sp. CA-139066 TaxID=3239930 RepID=UPI003D8F0BAF